jgi:hypothetical protein
MKKMLHVLVGTGAGCAVAALIVANHLTTRHAARLAEQQAAWQAEKTALEAELDEAKAKARARLPIAPSPAAPAATTPAPPPVPAKPSPEEILAKLVALKSASPNPARALRETIYWLEELIAAGPSALPAIRAFLARNEDLDFSAAGLPRGGRGPGGDFIFPPSLRFGLFDAVKQIGGAEAEQVLAEVLGSTGRGVELAWLARTLQDMAPNKYRDAALAAAKDLLARPPTANAGSPLDRNDRDQLFSVLSMFGDTSYVSTAQSQVLRADGQVDRSALKYLQQSIGQQAVALAAQWYDDPRITDPAQKEPFARLALNYVGADTQANDFYQKAINDMALSRSHRKNLIEDLNQDGFSDTRNLTANDLPLIQNRITLIESLAPHATDPVNSAAFKEAYKDLLIMRDKVTRPPQPAQ